MNGKQKYEVVTGEYYSNCMIEAVRAKIRNPQVKIYFCRPIKNKNGKWQSCHFMWSDGKADYDFSDFSDGCHNLIFKGNVRRFDCGFADRYTKYRNRIKGK